MDDKNQSATPASGNIQTNTDDRTSRVNRGKVIQPVSDMSEYTSKPSIPAPAPSPQSGPPAAVKSASPSYDPTQVYPTPTPTPTIPPATDSAPQPKQRVAVTVPALKACSFLLILYGLYSSIAVFGIFSLLNRYSSLGLRLSSSWLMSPVALIGLGTGAAFCLLGIYFLLAKNVDTVNSWLTVILIVGAIGLLNSIVSMARFSSSVTAASVFSLVISGGLLLYVWNVKSQVDLAATFGRQ